MEQENNVNMEQTTVNNTEVAEQSKESNNAQATENNKTEVKTFTQEQVNEMIKDRLAREQKKYEAERQQREEEEKQAKRLAKLSAEDKAKYEHDKLVEELNQLKAEKSKRELQDTARGLLQEKNIDTDLLEFLDYTDAETCKASIDKLSSAWNKAIEKAVNNRIKTNTVPKMANNSNTITKEQFNKMSYKEKLDLYNKDYDLYKKLAK